MLIIPAFLEEDSAKIIEKLAVLRSSVEWIQIDLADSSMTESTTCDLFDLVGEVDGFNVEVHLMTTAPEKYLDACAAVGAKRVYFHLGEVESPTEILKAMDPYDFTKGIALSPQTRAEDVFAYIDEIDAVQIMTVVPGNQGGEFLPDMLDKVSYVRERRGDIWISIDGGANADTIPEMKIRGVDAVGVGSAIVHADDMVKTFEQLQQLAAA
jgi:ribulose-phosphate 3-epimerase